MKMVFPKVKYHPFLIYTVTNSVSDIKTDENSNSLIAFKVKIHEPNQFLFMLL